MHRPIVKRRALLSFVPLIVLLICLNDSARAGTITTKNNVITGAKYSIDGSKYRGVGIEAKKLQVIMSDCPECLAELNTYSNYAFWGTVTGIGGGGLLGYGLGGIIAGREVESTEAILSMAGLTLTVMSFALSGASYPHLKRAVSQYNELASSSSQLDLSHRQFAHQRTPIVLKIRFSF